MATVLRIRDAVDVARIVAALTETVEAADGRGEPPGPDECRARTILANRLADALDDAVEERGLLRPR